MKTFIFVLFYLTGAAVLAIFGAASFLEIPAMKDFTDTRLAYVGMILMFIAFGLNYKWMISGNTFSSALMFLVYYLLFTVLTIMNLYYTTVSSLFETVLSGVLLLVGLGLAVHAFAKYDNEKVKA